jgi:muramidase (phage lysozyme)
MLGFTSLTAAVFLTSAMTPFSMEKALKPLSQEVSIRSAITTFWEPDPICNTCETFDNLDPKPYEITPERRALLNTIRFAEGTWKNGNDSGYRVMFGGSLTSSLRSHPNTVRYTTGYASAAAGAYQFMPSTWSEASRKLSLRTFEPRNQDQAALYLIGKRGALGLVDGGVLTPTLANKLSPEWASFPTYSGRSYYGQPVKRFEELRRFYKQNLESLRASLKLTENENV